MNHIIVGDVRVYFKGRDVTDLLDLLPLDRPPYMRVVVKDAALEKELQEMVNSGISISFDLKGVLDEC